jgi:hypothetical protein
MPTFTVRLPDNDYAALNAVSVLTGTAMAELVRRAVIGLVTEFASSGESEARLLDIQKRTADAQALLAHIAKQQDKERTDDSKKNDSTVGANGR